ncbi:MAG: DMT family transporter [Anaerolineae bacterium]|nr:DMT family transporter [Anaerolineae bacterium]
MISSHITGVSLALLASIFFGGADISGGLASRRITPFQTLAIASLSSVGMLLGFTLLWNESMPSSLSILWATLAGLCGALGLAALYKGLAAGKAVIVSPISGVVSAALPVIAAAFTQGMPNLYQTIGFAIALGGIWLVTQSPGAERMETREGIVLGLIAGCLFGLFFIFVARIEPGAVFFPLMFSKLTGFLIACIILARSRLPLPPFPKNPVAILSGLLDPLANAFYLLSTQHTRLDVAAVLSSLYPAVTVFLSLIFIKEHVTRAQWIGVGGCLAAIVLIIF